MKTINLKRVTNTLSEKEMKNTVGGVDKVSFAEEPPNDALAGTTSSPKIDACKGKPYNSPCSYQCNGKTYYGKCIYPLFGSTLYCSDLN